MSAQTQSKVIDIFLDVGYYVFVFAIVALITLTKMGNKNDGLLFANVVLLILCSLILVFYITLQIFRQNLITHKKSHLGVLTIILGFLLIISSILKLIIPNLESSIYVYWGIGCVALGSFIELTMLDEAVWISCVRMFRAFFNLLRRFFNKLFSWLTKNWRKVILTIADLGSITAIIFVSVQWPKNLYVEWWKVPLFVIAIAFFTIHHKTFVREILIFIFVDMLWHPMKIITAHIFNWFKEHWKTFILETLRLAASIGGIILIVYNHMEFHTTYVDIIGILIIVIAELFSRRSVLKFIYNTTKQLVLRTINFLYNTAKELFLATEWLITSTYHLFKALLRVLYTHWKTILIEILRFSGVVISAVLVWTVTSGPYSTSTWLIKGIIIALAVLIPLISECFSRRVVIDFTLENLDSIIRIIGAVSATIIIRLAIYYKSILDWEVYLLILSVLMFLFGKKLFIPKELIDIIRKNYITYTRIIGLCIGIYGAVFLGQGNTNSMYIALTIVGFSLLLFADPLLKPKTLLKLLQRIPWILKLSWRFTKWLAKIAYHNFLQLMLFTFALFALIYGIALLSGADFLSIFNELTLSVKVSIGLGFLTLSFAAFILFIHETKKKVKKQVASTIQRFLKRL